MRRGAIICLQRLTPVDRVRRRTHRVQRCATVYYARQSILTAADNGSALAGVIALNIQRAISNFRYQLLFAKAKT